MALKVIGAGVGRTGTHSLKIALQKLLGSPCYHMVEVFQHPEDVAVWHAAALGEKVDWHALFEGYSAAVDWPASAFWPELSQEFPEALIILSTRSAERWWESAHQTIFEATNLIPGAEMQPWLAMIQAVLGERFTIDVTNREACIAAFEKHNANVLKNAPPSRLIVWQASDGWAPICQALNLPIPDEPFPVTNTKEEFINRQRERKLESSEASPV